MDDNINEVNGGGMMNVHSSSTISSRSATDRVFAISLATLSMFILGYSATRVILNAVSAESASQTEVIIPHQAELWRAFGEPI